MLESESPNLILMYLSAPVKDGIATKIIRERENNSLIPLIPVTARGNILYRKHLFLNVEL
jgi:CheY-like chemotaxis protein